MKSNRKELRLSPLALASLFCLAFGGLLILNVQMASDGWWYWYAKLWRSGHSLYGELHYNMQPLFVLENALFQAVFGESWLASKVLAVLHLALFVAGFHLIVDGVPDFSRNEKALLMFATFVVAIHFELYRFDDYHVLGNILQLFSLVLLMRHIRRTPADGSPWALPATLGLLGGLATLTRLNDGIMLLFCTGFILLVGTARERRPAVAATFLATAALAAATILAINGEPPTDYLRQSVFEAAAIKGGIWDLLIRPFALVLDAANVVTGIFNWRIVVIATGFAWSLHAVLARHTRGDEPLHWMRAVEVGVLMATLALLITPIDEGRIFHVFGGIAVMLVLARAIQLFDVALSRRGRAVPAGEHLAPFLILIPFGYFVSGSLSSGGTYRSLTVPVAMSLPVLLMSIRLPPRARFMVLAVIALVGTSTLLLKASNPASWHGFRSPPLFMERTTVQHPIHGPMVIEEKLADLARDVCAEVGKEGSSLLSLPFPYFNWYCGIAPWRNYVQTFFDTSSRHTIDSLIADLTKHPPDFVMFQEQELNLHNHETMYSNGKPLPHRGLHAYIKQQIVSGAWTVRLERKYGINYTWYLIATKPSQ